MASQEITECENGDIILSLTVNHLLELKRWVLSYGDSAVVLEPSSQRNDVRDTLRRAGERYGAE